MRLIDLLAAAGVPQQVRPGVQALNGPPEKLEILGLSEDSRRVTAGDLFVARTGTKADGKAFVADAHAKGAVAVVLEQPLEGCPLPQVLVPDAAQAISRLAHALYGSPSLVVKTVGLTGTNGKTTTAYLLRHLLNAHGIKCGMIGTVQTDDGQAITDADMTTPPPTQVAQLLAAMRRNGCGACAMEVSSHALDQHRADGVNFTAAGFTNLTGDHLDYHGTMDAYAAAKARLFALLPSHGVAAVNADDPHAAVMVKDCRATVHRFGIASDVAYRASEVKATAAGTQFHLHTPRGDTAVRMRLIGRHNVENAMCAATLAIAAFGLTPQQVADGLADAAGAPGRLQSVSAGQPFAVLVDYAHTDDALANVLTALRALTRGRLRVLFGCGGDRDRTKRPRMAAIARKLADDVYITSDNPRTEDPEKIIADIVAGLGGEPASVDFDRHAAIARILQDAGPDDVVLLAGKGHENYQILGTTKVHFDDAEEATKVLKRISTAAA